MEELNTKLTEKKVLGILDNLGLWYHTWDVNHELIIRPNNRCGDLYSEIKIGVWNEDIWIFARSIVQVETSIEMFEEIIYRMFTYYVVHGFPEAKQNFYLILQNTQDQITVVTKNARGTNNDFLKFRDIEFSYFVQIVRYLASIDINLGKNTTLIKRYDPEPMTIAIVKGHFDFFDNHRQKFAKLIQHFPENQKEWGIEATRTMCSTHQFASFHGPKNFSKLASDTVMDLGNIIASRETPVHPIQIKEYFTEWPRDVITLILLGPSNQIYMEEKQDIGTLFYGLPFFQNQDHTKFAKMVLEYGFSDQNHKVVYDSSENTWVVILKCDTEAKFNQLKNVVFKGSASRPMNIAQIHIWASNGSPNVGIRSTQKILRYTTPHGDIIP